MSDGSRGFFEFYREYAKSGIHAASAALLTAFGLLTTINRVFMAVAVGVYILPLLYFYVTSNGHETDADSEHEESTDETPVADPASGDETPVDVESERTGETETETEPTWRTIDAPVDGTLYDVVATAGGAVAVGAGGVVLTHDGDWELVLEEGPGAAGETLRGVAASDDGRAVWFAGDGGALGVYDTEVSRHTDFSAPANITNTWDDIAVIGPAGKERVFLVNGSGQVLRGEREDGAPPTWDEPVKPGSGSSMSAIEFATDTVGFCCDTNGTVLTTTDGGVEYAVVGIDDADALTDIAPVSADRATVTATDGTLHRYDGSVWTPHPVSDGSLTAIARRGEEEIVVDDTGTIFGRDGSDWKRESSVNTQLRGVAVLDDGAVAVGDEGRIVDRR